MRDSPRTPHHILSLTMKRARAKARRHLPLQFRSPEYHGLVRLLRRKDYEMMPKLPKWPDLLEQIPERALQVAMYQLAGKTMRSCDEAFGWPEGTATAFNANNLEVMRRASHFLLDRAFESQQRARLCVMERLVMAADAATAILIAASEGREWDGRPVTMDQVRASELLLRRLTDLHRVKFTGMEEGKVETPVGGKDVELDGGVDVDAMVAQALVDEGVQ